MATFIVERINPWKLREPTGIEVTYKILHNINSNNKYTTIELEDENSGVFLGDSMTTTWAKLEMGLR